MVFKIWVKCVICPNEFMKKPHNRKKTCSSECSIIYNRERIRGYQTDYNKRPYAIEQRKKRYADPIINAKLKIKRGTEEYKKRARANSKRQIWRNKEKELDSALSIIKINMFK